MNNIDDNLSQIQEQEEEILIEWEEDEQYNRLAAISYFVENHGRNGFEKFEPFDPIIKKTIDFTDTLGIARKDIGEKLFDILIDDDVIKELSDLCK